IKSGELVTSSVRVALAILVYRVRPKRLPEYGLLVVLDVVEKYVLNPGPIRRALSKIVLRSRSLPDDVVLEAPGTENRVHQHFEIVTRGVVTVQVDRAGRL